MHSRAATAILLTTGEPAGVGPELAVQLLQQPVTGPLCIAADPGLLLERAALLQLPLALSGDTLVAPGGQATLLAVDLSATPSQPGRPETANAPYVVQMLQQAVDGCLGGDFAALVTGPVQKSTLIEAGNDFVGHTEFLAERSGVKTPVMMLVSDSLRVALVTIHMPLVEVAGALTREHMQAVLRVVDTELRTRFSIPTPVIGVCGLNPHAGEAGHLGREEIEVIIPVLEALRTQGLDLRGPLPADTAFTSDSLSGLDVVVAMYHDQGLPVIKHAGFGAVVNITLGLPFVRTSVDHGTALDLAGTGRADVGSLAAAVRLARQLSDGF
ncbi:MAG: 4-hydroxythreonine-4-phosphate dehydrogenase PdxA [Arenicellales bacterium]|nr:4-hydroxythreonine-4-phosphate dehydrogenase PdxA [Arenicellales bacterium]MEE1567456.1 4-hydroxythreonine-4-phosphate dehydrogenase PdxA [Arenicellales bacterium]